MFVGVQGRGQQIGISGCDVNVTVPVEVAYGLDVNPIVEVGDIKTYTGRRRICRKKDGKYVMYQIICVEIPLDIDIEVECLNDISNHE